MKNLMCIGMILLFSEPSLVWSNSYSIQLENGGQFITNLYWEEGNQIMFYIYGGIAGVQKKFVKSISESKLSFKDENEDKSSKSSDDERKISNLEKIKDNEPTKGDISTSEGTGEKIQGEKRSPEGIDFEYYRKTKIKLRAQFNQARENYLQASSNKDPEAKELARKEMVEFSKQIYDLADELKRKNNGVLPDWWEQ
jgi:hypothetical protein